MSELKLTGDERVAMVMAYVQAGKRGCSLEEALACAVEEVISRRTQPEATKPAQDLGAAILAIEYGADYADPCKQWAFDAGFKAAVKAAAALASPADALVAGDSAQSEDNADAKDAERYRWYRSCGDERDQLAILDARGNIIPEELDAEIDARIAAIQAQKDGHD